MARIDVFLQLFVQLHQYCKKPGVPQGSILEPLMECKLLQFPVVLYTSVYCTMMFTVIHDKEGDPVISGVAFTLHLARTTSSVF